MTKRLRPPLFILFNLLLVVNLSLAEKNAEMGIGLVAVGKVDKQILDELKDALSDIFNKQVSIGKDIPEPDYAFNEKRRQYLSTAILDKIMQEKDYAAFEKVLGVVDYDLYVPELNFVFGEASSRVAVISLVRLRQQFYGLAQDQNLFRKRVLTEAVHELGHTYGLSHCSNLECVMFFSNSLADTDRKGYQFCSRCRSRLEKE